MITEEYIEDIMLKSGIAGNVHFISGYDATMALLENARTQFPVIIVEDNTSGVFSADYGGIDTFEQSIWVMCSINERDGISKAKASEQAMNIVKKLLAVIIDDKDSHQANAYSLDISSMPYFQRNNTIASGWELQLTFNESVNLSIYD